MAKTQKSQFPISPEVLLSVATVPLLGGLLVSKAIAELTKTVGMASEEIFRGDRLPMLNLKQKDEGGRRKAEG